MLKVKKIQSFNDYNQFATSVNPCVLCNQPTREIIESHAIDPGDCGEFDGLVVALCPECAEQPGVLLRMEAKIFKHLQKEKTREIRRNYQKRIEQIFNLHAQGVGYQEIRDVTGYPLSNKTIAKLIRDFKRKSRMKG
jgi:hypothetical protein